MSKFVKDISWWNDTNQKSYIYTKYPDLWKNDLIKQEKKNISQNTKPDYKMYKQTSGRCDDMKSFSKTMLMGIQEESTLSHLFFSQKNINNLQNLIRKRVYDASQQKYVIDNQNQDELLLIMRYIYLQYAINQNIDFKNQIMCLNENVVENVLPNILSAVELYQKYMQDASQPYYTMDRPLFESVTGTKSYDLSRFV